MPRGEEENLTDKEKPSTSAGFTEEEGWDRHKNGGGRLARMQRNFQIIRLGCQGFLVGLRHRCEGLILTEDGPIQRRLDKWREGWRRVISIYPRDERKDAKRNWNSASTLEWKLLKYTFIISTITSFFLSVRASRRESVRRFEVYAVGKTYQSKFKKMNRLDNYDRIRNAFLLLKSFSQAAIICSITGLTVGITAYRDRYALWHFPLSIGTILTLVSFYRGLGIQGFYIVIYITLFFSSFLTLLTLAASKCAGFDSVASAYKRLQQLQWENSKRKMEEYEEVVKYSVDRGFYFLGNARRSMLKEKELGTWRGEQKESEAAEELVKFAELGDDFGDDQDERGKGN